MDNGTSIDITQGFLIPLCSFVNRNLALIPFERRLAKYLFFFHFIRSGAGWKAGRCYQNSGRDLINQRRPCMKHKPKLSLRWGGVVLALISLRPGSWHLPPGKTNYNIRLVLLLLIMFFWRPAVPWVHFPLAVHALLSHFEIQSCWRRKNQHHWHT